MSAESVRIINAALSRSTGNLIDSVDDGSPEAILAAQNYEQVVNTELSGPGWRFARKTEACTLLPDAPIDTDFTYAWQLPDGVVVLRTIIVCGQPVDYQIDEAGIILTNHCENVYAVFTYRASEDLWPYDFREGVTRRLEALYLRLDSRFSEAAARDNDAERVLAHARLTHSQEEYPHDPGRFPLITARRIGNARCRR